MKIKELILELLYPSRCAFCGKVLKSGEGICRYCEKTLPYTGSVNARQQLQSFCCVSPLYYENAVRSALLRYKFAGAAVHSRTFGKLMAKCIDEMSISCDIITWVPLSRRRLRTRGYDQARLLAEELAAARGVPCVPTLKKIRNTPAQSGISDRENRIKNVAGVYALECTEDLSGRRILLVDDIVTTGSTLSEAVKMLKAGGAGEIIAVTAARKRT